MGEPGMRSVETRGVAARRTRPSIRSDGHPFQTCPAYGLAGARAQRRRPVQKLQTARGPGFVCRWRSPGSRRPIECAGTHRVDEEPPGVIAVTDVGFADAGREAVLERPIGTVTIKNPIRQMSMGLLNSGWIPISVGTGNPKIASLNVGLEIRVSSSRAATQGLHPAFARRVPPPVLPDRPLPRTDRHPVSEKHPAGRCWHRRTEDPGR